MIPASDLRIKNYILNHHRQLCFVKKISDDDVVEVTKAGTHETYFCMSEELSPIPLGGWLDNLGFEQNKFHKVRSEEHTSELQSRENLVCRLLLEKKNSEIA